MDFFRVVDLETSGIDPGTDAIVEIACLDVTDDGIISDKPYMSLVKSPVTISPEASATHHLIDADLASAPPAREAIPAVLRPDDNPIYVSHNAVFESAFLRPWLASAQFLCTYKSSLRVYPQAPKHSNQVLRYWLGLNPDRAIADKSHRAFPDVLVTAHLLVNLLGKASVADMLRWSQEPPLLPKCPIGKQWRGQPWSAIDYGFLSWIIGNVDDPDIVWNAKYEMERRAKVQQAEREAEKQSAREAQVLATQDDLAGCRDAYVKGCLAVIKVTPTYEELKQWVKDEAAHRAQWGIVSGDSYYTTIQNALKARKEEIEREQQREVAA